jgi:hypothetical protein
MARTQTDRHGWVIFSPVTSESLRFKFQFRDRLSKLGISVVFPQSLYAGSEQLFKEDVTASLSSVPSPIHHSDIVFDAI